MERFCRLNIARKVLFIWTRHLCFFVEDSWKFGPEDFCGFVPSLGEVACRNVAL